jgi:GT2 family glycosyltransferase
MIKVLISILNWNASVSTIQCVNSLLSDQTPSDIQVLIRVIDNGSNDTEVALLSALNHPGFDVVFNPVNTGFTGGQNSNIQYALDHNFDFVWLLNNDTSVPVGTVATLIKHMQLDSKCGAVSPLIVRLGKPDVVDFCGAAHDWVAIDTLRPATLAAAPAFIAAHKERVWAVGTALMLRTSTIRQVGMLDDRLFAYYDDDDYGARLMQAGWVTRIALDARVEHACYEGDMYQRPPYFFYLTTRNAVFFAIAHVPPGFRRLLRVRYLTRSFFTAEKLYDMGYAAKADACLLGFADGVFGRGGPPVLNRPLPIWIKALRPLLRWWNGHKRR